MSRSSARQRAARSTSGKDPLSLHRNNDLVMQTEQSDYNRLALFRSYNSDGLSLLDVAVLANSVDMVKLLVRHGAREGTECKSEQRVKQHFDRVMTRV